MKRRTASFSMTVLIGLALLSAVAHAQDPLPSWNDGKAKQAIVEFVTKVTKEGARTSSRPPNASPPSTTTARSGPSSRCISNSSSRSTA